VGGSLVPHDRRNEGRLIMRGSRGQASQSKAIEELMHKEPKHYKAVVRSRRGVILLLLTTQRILKKDQRNTTAGSEQMPPTTCKPWVPLTAPLNSPAVGSEGIVVMVVRGVDVVLLVLLVVL